MQQKTHYLHSAAIQTETSDKESVCLFKTYQHIFINVQNTLADSRGRGFKCVGIKHTNGQSNHNINIRKEFSTCFSLHHKCNNFSLHFIYFGCLNVIHVNKNPCIKGSWVMQYSCWFSFQEHKGFDWAYQSYLLAWF